MFNEEDEIIQGFIEESSENLAQMEEDFLVLEQNTEEIDIERINGAFRCVHSIKGSAGFLGLTHISELAHSMENLMDQIRKGSMVPDQDTISLLLEGVDHLNAMFAAPQESNEYSIEEIHGRITQYTAEMSGPKLHAHPPQEQKEQEQDAAESIGAEPQSQEQASAGQPQEESTTAGGGQSDQEPPRPHVQGKTPTYAERFVMEAFTVLSSVDRCARELSMKQKGAGLVWVNLAIESLEDIKSASTLLGYKKIHALAHVMAVMLGLVRSEALSPDQISRDILQDGINLLKTLITDAENSEDYDIREDHDRLVALAAKGFFQQFDFDDYQVWTPPSFLTPEETAKQIATSLVEVNAEGAEIHRSEPQETAASQAPAQPQEPSETQTDATGKEVVAERVIHPKREQPKKKAAVAPSNREQKSEQESIRVRVGLLNHLITLTGEMVLVRNQQLQLMNNPNPAALKRNTQRLDVVTSELQECVMQTRMQPVGTLFHRFNRVVRDLSQNLGKEITLSISGSDVEIDKSILEALADPLTHMIRNSCDHGIEMPDERAAAGKSDAGQLHLSAWHEGGQVHIELKDDGHGINVERVAAKALERGLKTQAELNEMSEREIQQLVLLPGFSTADKVSDLSGRGVGMDVVRSNIEKIGGHLELESIQGKGTSVRLRLPLTLAIIPCLVVAVDQYQFAIPQVNLVELVTYSNEEVLTNIEIARGREVCRLRDELLPLIRLNEVLSHDDPMTDADYQAVSNKYKTAYSKDFEEYQRQREKSRVVAENFRLTVTFAVLKIGDQRYGLIVDEVKGTEEIVVKSMHGYLKDLAIYNGSTVMGDGRVALILDVMGVAKHSGLSLEQKHQERLVEKQRVLDDTLQNLLLFKYGKEEQFAISLNMVRRIERIEAKDIKLIGAKEFITIDQTSFQILRLGNMLNVSEYVEQKRPYLLVPKLVKKPFGILISSIQDIVETAVELDENSIKEPGVMGTALINEVLTLFIDYFSLVELADPTALDHIHKEHQRSQKYKLLLVEDVPFFRSLVSNYLRAGGYEVVTAGNGKEALEKYQQEHFDMIVSDIEMPLMDGFELAKTIRKIHEDTKIPLLALTGLSSEEDRQKALDCGFDAYEVKLDREHLLKILQAMLSEVEPYAMAAGQKLLESKASS